MKRHQVTQLNWDGVAPGRRRYRPPGRFSPVRACQTLLLAFSIALLSLSLQAAEPLCDTDIDGNGSAEAASDGKLLVRHLFGFQGEALTEGLIGEGCTRCDAAAIASHLESTACQVLFDIDGDGTRRPLTDGCCCGASLQATAAQS
ncbi:hypothetical protein U5801_25365 [Lamprobacter modestohalophilus]|uniref:hypothetical protein n=1 Tax=Lamprobacter modestohalophilus TaxID=1064514 RepID=UPI002ADEB139|nr:hypothetical protein [Lamprobacter modestohalophilus]MEA1053113.1 hypothetical protein [Lamprobacter modestohalophilus]